MTQEQGAAALGEALIGGYTREAEMYHALLGLAREQSKLLQPPGDVGRYAALFHRKDELLRSISRTDAELEPLKQRWWDEEVTADLRDRLNCLLDWILVTIEAILAEEQRNEQLLAGLSTSAGAGLGLVAPGVPLASASPPQPVTASS